MICEFQQYYEICIQSNIFDFYLKTSEKYLILNINEENVHPLIESCLNFISYKLIITFKQYEIFLNIFNIILEYCKQQENNINQSIQIMHTFMNIFNILQLLFKNIKFTLISPYIDLLYESNLLHIIMGFICITNNQSRQPIFFQLHLYSNILITYLSLGNEVEIDLLLQDNMIFKLLSNLREFENDDSTIINSTLCSLTNLISDSSSNLQLILDSKSITRILYLPIIFMQTFEKLLKDIEIEIEQNKNETKQIQYQLFVENEYKKINLLENNISMNYVKM
jgi:hypothetical protein